MSIFRGFKEAWKHIRTLEWKRDGTEVPLERVRSLARKKKGLIRIIVTQLTIESKFLHYFRIRNSAKRSPVSKLFKTRIVALSFSTLCLRISQFYFSMETGKGYNSVVECHLDVVEVISSSLIIPKPNVSFSILTCPPAVIE